jgi:alkylation response protein AidB-like acyl-CoA dehydrogenase
VTSDLADVRAELRGIARALLAKAGAAPGWQLMADSGWLGLETDIAVGGGGGTFAELAVILEELGRAAAVSPYLGSVVLGTGTLAALAPAPWRDELLREVTSGRRLVAVALATGDETVTGEVAPFRIERSAGLSRLQGTAAFVPDAADADRILLLARDASAVPVVVAVARDLLKVEPQPVLDSTRRLARVTADGAALSAESIWHLAGDPEAAARGLADRAALAIACDSLGLGHAMLAATVTYAGQRQQFGRPIGSFQAVKHACADMFVRLSIARELVDAAAAALADGASTAATAVSMAKSYTCSAGVDVTGKAMQLHGGIGYTWESRIHVYLKRAMLNRSLFGSPVAHRRRLARRYA